METSYFIIQEEDLTAYLLKLPYIKKVDSVMSDEFLGFHLNILVTYRWPIYLCGFKALKKFDAYTKEYLSQRLLKPYTATIIS
jgi:hypothetical protein